MVLMPMSNTEETPERYCEDSDNRDSAGCEPVTLDWCSKAENRMDHRCSCYNVVYGYCNDQPGIPGCKEGLEYVEESMEHIPPTPGKPHHGIARLQYMRRLHCPGNVCVGYNKPKPAELSDLYLSAPCSFNLNMCNQNTQIDSAVGDTSVLTVCEINENFMGTDPWEYEVDEDELRYQERLHWKETVDTETQRQDDLDARRLAVEKAKQDREFKTIAAMGAGTVSVFCIIVLSIMM